MQAGLTISGINAEVMPGQWEFQIGPTGPLETGDQVGGRLGGRGGRRCAGLGALRRCKGGALRHAPPRPASSPSGDRRPGGYGLSPLEPLDKSMWGGCCWGPGGGATCVWL